MAIASTQSTDLVDPLLNVGKKVVLAIPKAVNVLTKAESNAAAIDVDVQPVTGSKLKHVLALGKLGKPFVIGGAIPVASSVAGAAVGSAFATPIILKSIAFPSLAAAKTAVVMAKVPLAVDLMRSKVDSFTNRLMAKGTKVVNKAKTSAIIGVKLLKKGAVGAAVKTAAAVKAGKVLLVKATVKAGRLALKPIAIVAGSHLKLLGGALGLFGTGVKLTGTALTKAGTGLKLGGLGGIGLGATAISWGLDKSSIDKQLDEDVKLIKPFIPSFKSLAVPAIVKKFF